MLVAMIMGLQIARAETDLCDARVWVSDPDPNGLNVRAEPKAKSKVLGTLPTSTELTLVSSKNGWFKFTKPVAFTPRERVDWEQLKSGPQTGWVHGSMITTSLRLRWDNERRENFFSVYSEPSQSSTVLKRWVGPDSPGSDIDAVRMLFACSGGWLKMTVEDANKTSKTGWVHSDNQCPNQVTTCP